MTASIDLKANTVDKQRWLKGLQSKMVLCSTCNFKAHANVMIFISLAVYNYCHFNPLWMLWPSSKSFTYSSALRRLRVILGRTVKTCVFLVKPVVRHTCWLLYTNAGNHGTTQSFSHALQHRQETPLLGIKGTKPINQHSAAHTELKHRYQVLC